MHQINKQTNKQTNMNLTIEIISYQLIRFVYWWCIISNMLRWGFS